MHIYRTGVCGSVGQVWDTRQKGAAVRQERVDVTIRVIVDDRRRLRAKTGEAHLSAKRHCRTIHRESRTLLQRVHTTPVQ